MIDPQDNIATSTTNFNNNLPPTSFCAAKSAWESKSIQLSAWTQKHLINRSDVYGKYYSGGTATAKSELRDADLVSHFCGNSLRVGLHSHDRDGLGKWICLDIDAHGEAAPHNWEKVLSVCDVLTSWGIVPIVEHSNGNFGFKIWVVFNMVAPCKTLRAIGMFLNSEDEVFPKSFDQKSFGNYVRLPGRHHKHLNWHSDFYDLKTQKWLRGADAVNHLLSFKPACIDLVPNEAKKFVEPPKPAPVAANVATGQTGDWSDYAGNLFTLDIVALSEERLTGANSGNIYGIVCPWNSEHTTGDTGTCVFVNEDGFPGFNCQHAHCADRSLKDYLATYDTETVDGCCSEEWIGFDHVDDDEVDRVVANINADDLSLDGIYDGLEMLRRSLASKSDYLFDNLVESGVITLFTGLPYSGKSLVVLQLIVKLLTQNNFYGQACRSKPVPILYVNADRMRDKQFHRRLATVCQDDAVLMSVLPYIYFTEVEDLPATLSAEYLARFVSNLKTKHNAETVLVVIDTLRPAFLLEQGAGAENDSGIVSKLLTPIRQIAKQENLAVLLLHHNNRSRDDFAGSAAIAGSTEAVWTITKIDNMAKIKIENREIGTFSMEVTLGPKLITEPVIDPLVAFINEWPETIDGAWTRKEAQNHFADMPDKTLRRKIEESQRPGIHPRLERVGAGTKEVPYRYFQV